MNNVDIDINELKTWIGNEEITYDEVSINLERRFRATLDEDPGMPQKGERASSGIHWALAPSVVKSSLLGKDSHPKKGEFLPPIPLPRRMWAGCQTKFLKPLLIKNVFVLTFKYSSLKDGDVTKTESAAFKLLFSHVLCLFFVKLDIGIFLN